MNLSEAGQAMNRPFAGNVLALCSTINVNALGSVHDDFERSRANNEHWYICICIHVYVHIDICIYIK